MQVDLTDWLAISPALCVIATAILVVFVDLFRGKRESRLPLVVISSLGLVGALALDLNHVILRAPAMSAFGGAVVLDDLSALLSIAIGVAALFHVLMSGADLARRDIDGGEYHGLLLLSTASMMLLVGSTDFIMVFLNLEILSLALYVLTGITRKNPRSNEAAVKYLVNGAFATGFLLFGMALLYGVTGSLSLTQMGASLAGGTSSTLVVPGIGLLLVGLAFKVGAVPFHMWVPDVYEGAPTPVTAFMSVAVKAAGFGVLVRVLTVSLGSYSELWGGLLWWMAVATMVGGNLMALQQQSVKRMLAYSSVAHTGYALVGLAVMQGADGAFVADSASAVVFYVVVYTVMTLGAFSFLVYIGHSVQHPKRSTPEWQDGESIEDFAGLGARRPWAALAMTVFLLSLAGIPPTVGFIGKFVLFQAAVTQGHYVLAIIGVLASLTSIYYYLRPIVYMYMRPAVHTDDVPDASVGFVIGTMALATLVLGMQPGLLLFVASRSIEMLG